MRRGIGLLLVIGVVLPLAVTGSASAQGARLKTPPTATPGQVITVTGDGFNRSSANIAGGVDIRLSTRDSDVLANALPDSRGSISASVRVPPSLAPGEYLLLGTQLSVRGRHTFGGPGRAKLRVVAPAGGAAGPGSAPGATPPPAVFGGILALIVLAGWMTLAVRRLRTLSQPLGS
ncbi:MAG: hypothetical protein M3N47_09800 [Chloroflexota bacterium]|nr:hypothetical protein [Chloroflexota bacterium]